MLSKHLASTQGAAGTSFYPGTVMAVSHTPVRTIDSAGNAVEESPTYTIAYSDHDEETNVFERYIKINPKAPA